MRYECAAGSRQYAEAALGVRGGASRAPALPTAYCLLPARSARGGFTFTEVMFAVILLGIGFIMLAGMFPVAIQQTAQTQQETAGASLTLAAVKQLSQNVTQDTLLPTGGPTSAGGYVPPMVLSFRERFHGDEDPKFYRRTIQTTWTGQIPSEDRLFNPLWKMARGDVIFSEDPRYGFVPFYQRTPDQNVAKLIVIAVQSQNAGTYEFARDVITQDEYQGNFNDRSPYATLEPRRLEAVLSDGGPDVDIIELKKPNIKIDGADPLDCVGEGAFVVVSDDRLANDGWVPGDERGRANGRIYRIGARRTDLDGTNLNGGRAWELVPGYDMASRLENLPLPAEPSPFPQVPSDTNSEWYGNTDYSDHIGNDPAIVYVVGRPQEDPTNEDSPYTGLVQDIAAYTTYINLK